MVRVTCPSPWVYCTNKHTSFAYLYLLSLVLGNYVDAGNYSNAGNSVDAGSFADTYLVSCKLF